MATKYPIILVHGIFMKPRFFHVFRYIQNKLLDAGYHVYVADTDGIGTIENNAIQLQSQIEAILEAEKTEKINIVAHSKGGLEAVYLIEKTEAKRKIASLTTICTPYRGSAVATWVNNLPPFILTPFIFCCDRFYKILGDKKPDLRRALVQLDVNDSIEEKDFSEIYFQSYSSTMKKASSDLVLSIPYVISTHHEKNNSDGMVSKKSARYANYMGDCIDDSISHNEIVCYMTRKSKKEKVAEFYINLCCELVKIGC